MTSTLSYYLWFLSYAIWLDWMIAWNVYTAMVSRMNDHSMAWVWLIVSGLLNTLPLFSWHFLLDKRRYNIFWHANSLVWLFLFYDASNSWHLLLLATQANVYWVFYIMLIIHVMEKHISLCQLAHRSLNFECFWNVCFMQNVLICNAIIGGDVTLATI